MLYILANVFQSLHQYSCNFTYSTLNIELDVFLTGAHIWCTREAEVLNSLIMTLTAKEKDVNNIS